MYGAACKSPLIKCVKFRPADAYGNIRAQHDSAPLVPRQLHISEQHRLVKESTALSEHFDEGGGLFSIDSSIRGVMLERHYRIRRPKLRTRSYSYRPIGADNARLF